jgi:thioredoxin-dependent peroxiredoxin
MNTFPDSRISSRIAFCLVASALACANTPAKTPDGGSGTSGATRAADPSAAAPSQALVSAPEFSAKDADGKTVKLQDLRGSLVVVYFYPKDETPGCTKEACAFRDAFAEYTKRGIKIVGVSQDSEESHKQFRTKHQLPFLLVADTDGAISKAFNVKSTMGMSSRVTYLLDREGKIVRNWPDVDPGVHAAEVLAFAATVTGSK